MIIRGFAEYDVFHDTAMGKAEEEVAVEEEVAAEDEPDDNLGQAIRDTQRDCVGVLQTRLVNLCDCRAAQGR
jgi:hypothetical protein